MSKIQVNMVRSGWNFNTILLGYWQVIPEIFSLLACCDVKKFYQNFQGTFIFKFCSKNSILAVKNEYFWASRHGPIGLKFSEILIHILISNSWNFQHSSLLRNQLKTSCIWAHFDQNIAIFNIVPKLVRKRAKSTLKHGPIGLKFSEFLVGILTSNSWNFQPSS